MAHGAQGMGRMCLAGGAATMGTPLPYGNARESSMMGTPGAFMGDESGENATPY